jgi:hypothetical protein
MCAAKKRMGLVRGNGGAEEYEGGGKERSGSQRGEEEGEEGWLESITC